VLRRFATGEGGKTEEERQNIRRAAYQEILEWPETDKMRFWRSCLRDPQFKFNAALELANLGDASVFDMLLLELTNRNRHPAYVMGALGQLGDFRAIEPLLKCGRRRWGEGEAAMALTDLLAKFGAPNYWTDWDKWEVWWNANKARIYAEKEAAKRKAEEQAKLWATGQPQASPPPGNPPLPPPPTSEHRRPLPPTAKPAASPVPPPVGACGKCGKPLPAGARFCPSCGSKVAAGVSGPATTPAVNPAE
jgi:hypothetical protein